jgi:hypothetical protein
MKKAVAALGGGLFTVVALGFAPSPASATEVCVVDVNQPPVITRLCVRVAKS